MIYECTAGLLLTLSTTAGACHSNTVPHFLLSIINTEAFHSNHLLSLFLPSPLSTSLLVSFTCLSLVISLFLLSLSLSLCDQRQAKYTENKLKAIKARNEYLLALEATNSCVFKYYIHDLADIIDVSINTCCCAVGAHVCGQIVCLCVVICSSCVTLRATQWWRLGQSLHISFSALNEGSRLDILSSLSSLLCLFLPPNTNCD